MSQERRFDAAALERWLGARPPTTLLALADRMLWHSVAGRDLDAFAAFFADVERAAASEFAGAHLTTLCVLCALYGDAGRDVDGVRGDLALAASVVGLPAHEPWRSTARYWRFRAGLARTFEPPRRADAPDPSRGVAGFSFCAHAVLFAAGYGAAVVDDSGEPARSRGAAERTEELFDDAVARVDADDGDCVALLWLCALCVGRDPSPWIARLGALQNDDGSLVTRVDEDAARHHAACVALLARDLTARAGNGALAPTSPE